MPDIIGMDIPALIHRAGGRAKFQAGLNVARTTVLDWERLNRIPANRAAQISETFGIPLCEVIKLAPGPRAKVEAA